MPKTCKVSGKGPSAGRTISRRGMAKKKGGVGKRITGVSKRVFKPNLQKIKTIINGKVTRLWVCAKCIKADKIQKAK